MEITGSIGHEAVDELRRDLDGARVSMASGFAGERLVRILGDLTHKQVEAVRAFLLRMLGGEQISRIVLKRGSIEISNVSIKDLGAVKEFIDGLQGHVGPPRSK